MTQVNGMTSLGTVTQLVTLLATLALSNVLFAGESIKNAHKDNGTGNTISNADAAGHVDGDFYPAVKTGSGVNSQQRFANDFRIFTQMGERRRQMHEAQLEAYRCFTQERRQQSAADSQTQGRAYIKLMDERHALMKKMVDKHRQAAEERRKSMLLKMHQTSTTPAGSTTEWANRA